MKSDGQICWFSSYSLPYFLPYITPLLLHRSKFGHRIISLLHVLGAVALHRSFHIGIRHVLSRGFLEVVPIAVMDPHWTHPLHSTLPYIWLLSTYATLCSCQPGANRTPT